MCACTGRSVGAWSQYARIGHMQTALWACCTVDVGTTRRVAAQWRAVGYVAARWTVWFYRCMWMDGMAGALLVIK